MSTATVVAVALGVTVTIAFIAGAYIRRWPWAGFARAPGAEQGPKTLWDWLQLLVIPLGLAAVAFALNLAQSGREQRREDHRAALERSIADDRRREDALGIYVQQMSELMLERGLLKSREAEIQAIARTLTLSVLRRLDGGRKGFVVQFLGEAGLISAQNPKIRMGGADLRGARISGSLEGVDLGSTDLREVDFRGSSLRRVQFDFADLRRADFRKADVLEVSFADADLRRADFRSAGVTGGSFYRADVSRANFDEAGIYDVVFAVACLIETRFNRAELTFVDFKAVSGRDVDLSDAKLEAVKFQGTLLVRVNLAGARLVGSSRPSPNEKPNLRDPDCDLLRLRSGSGGPKAGP